MSVCIVDTSVLCELLMVPGKSSKSGHQEAKLAMRAKSEAQEKLLLPVVTIVETGNHIGQVPDGRERRNSSKTFRNFVISALDGEAPFLVTPPLDVDELRKVMEDFESWTEQRAGLADKSIVSLWEQCCETFPQKRVYIWSRDKHLSSYDRKR